MIAYYDDVRFGAMGSQHLIGFDCEDTHGGNGMRSAFLAIGLVLGQSQYLVSILRFDVVFFLP